MIAKPTLTANQIAASRKSPRYYLEKILGVVPTLYQVEIMEAVRDEQETAARSANGVGKSFIAACLASWFFDCFSNPLVLIAAPKYDQAVKTFNLCCSLRRASPYDLPGERRTGNNARLFVEVDGAGKWEIQPRVGRDAERFAGEHSDHVLLIMEEASGLDDDLWAAAYGCVVDDRDRVLAIGNPTKNTGKFAQYFGPYSKARQFTLSVMDTPNYQAGRTVVPGLSGKQYVERMVRMFGAMSDTYRVRVQGLPPRGSGNALFSYAMIEKAKERGAAAHDKDGEPLKVSDDREVFGGFDIAHEGDDKSSIVTLDDGVVTRVQVWEHGDTLENAERGRAWLKRFHAGKLLCDVGGLGVGVYDILKREFPGRVIAVNFGGSQVLGKIRVNAGQWRKTGGAMKSGETPWYYNRRTEIWCEAADWTRDHGCWHPDLNRDLVEELEADLQAVEADPSAEGPLKIKKKTDTKKELGRSPDIGDAYCLAVAGLVAMARPRWGGEGVGDYSEQDGEYSSPFDQSPRDPWDGYRVSGGGLDLW